MAEARYRRVVLKISGESLRGETPYGIDPVAVNYLSGQIGEASKLGVQIAVVMGGGNIWRGEAAESRGMDRATADYAGMLATIINALALQDSLEHLGIDVRTQSALQMQAVAEPYIRRRAIRHLEKGRVVLFAAGTGNPYVTTDTGAALRATEIKAEVLLKATKVDGVYTADPVTHPDAKRIDHLSFDEVINRRLAVMDLSAVDLCQRSKIPIIVFDLKKAGNMRAVVEGKRTGTIIDGRGSAA